MKAFIAVAIMMVSGAAFANDLKVTASLNDGQSVAINWTTKQTFSSMCGMGVDSLKLKPVTQTWQGDVQFPGAIEIETSTNRFAMCMMAFGPHRGGMNLPLGYQLPHLADGEYNLLINGQDYGVLSVSAEEVFLTAADELN